MSHYKIEPKRIRFIHPYADKEPVLVMVEGVRGARPGVKIDPPIIIYDRQTGGGITDGRNALSVRDAYREPGRYDVPGGARLKGSRI